MGALWTLVALASLRRQLDSKALPDVAIGGARWIPRGSGRGVAWMLGLRRASCLERALIAQAWSAARGRPRAVVVGVRLQDEGFAAHAWLDGDSQHHGGMPFDELLRLGSPP